MKIKEKLISKLISFLTPLPDPQNVLMISKGDVIFNPVKLKVLKESELQLLKGEATAFSNMELHKYMLESLEHSAKLRMFEKSSSSADLMFGKAVLYVVDVQKKMLNKLVEHKPKK